MTLPIKTLKSCNGVKLIFVLILWTIFILCILNFSQNQDSIELEFFGRKSDSTKDEQIVAIESEHPSIPFYYMSTRTKNSNCSRFPSLASLSFHNTYFQTLVKGNYILQLYNAYYDTRAALRNGPFVRILAMSNTTVFKNQTFYCQLWYEDTLKPSIVKVAQIKLMWIKAWGVPNKHLFPHIINCPTSSTQNVSLIPKVVSLVSSECETATNGLRIHYNVPAYPNETKQEYAICVKGLNYPYVDISARLVEWIELQFILGATKIYFYKLGVHPNVTKVLEYYVQRNLIDVRPTTIADDIPNLPSLQYLLLKKYHLKKVFHEILVYNDCFYRNVYRYDFIAIQDIDEVLMPLGNITNWHDLIALEKQKRSEKCHNGIYCFRNVYFSSVNGTDTTPYAPEIPSFMHMLQHVERRHEHMGKGLNIKCLHGTSYVSMLHNHFPFGELAHCPHYHINTDIAQMQHYRKRPVLKRAMNDTSIWRFKDELQQRTLYALREMGFIRKLKYPKIK